MNIPETDVTLQELLDQMPVSIQFVDKNRILRYLNKTAAARPAKCKREVGIDIRNCHAKSESLDMIEKIFEEFGQGRREPHYYVTSGTRKTVMMPIFDAGGGFTGVLSYSHPAGLPDPDRSF